MIGSSGPDGISPSVAEEMLLVTRCDQSRTRPLLDASTHPAPLYLLTCA